MDTLSFSKIMIPGLSLLMTLVFGLWLSRSGKPYNGLLFNGHKLIALAAVILIARLAYKSLAGSEHQSLIYVLSAVAALSVIVLFFTGAMMSAEKLSYWTMLTIHRIGPVILVITLATILYLL